MNFLFFLFCQSIALNSHAVGGHQMYFGASVVRKASTIGIEISPTPPLIFTGVGSVKNCEIWRRFQHHSRVWKYSSNISERWNKLLV